MNNVQEVRPKKVPLKLDKERTLFFDLNAFAELEEAYGSVEDAMKAMESGSVKAVRLLVWAGLIHEEMDENDNYLITPKQVGSWITLDRMQELSEKLGKAVRQAVPKEAQDEFDKAAKDVPSVPLAKPTSQEKQ